MSVFNTLDTPPPSPSLYRDTPMEAIALDAQHILAVAEMLLIVLHADMPQSKDQMVSIIRDRAMTIAQHAGVCDWRDEP
jgi:hypothetical protein